MCGNSRQRVIHISTAGAEDLRRFQLHMRSRKASATTMNAAVSALRLFFGVTPGRDDAPMTNHSALVLS